MITSVQNNFVGGMNLYLWDSFLGDTEYKLAKNIRNRAGVLEPVKKATVLSNAPAGLKQGILAFENYLLIFVAGKAYYSTNQGTSWTEIAGFQMSTTAPRLYTQAVPASSANYLRQLTDASNTAGTIYNNNVTVNSIAINGNPAGLVVQDGLNQPWIIFSDATARALKTYAEWTAADREYVPIGLNMCFKNGILFVLSPDKKRILRSVSGRPLDFVVNVNATGDKGGTAETVHYAVGYDESNCLLSIKTGELLVATNYNAFPLELNYESTIFAEPTFKNLTPQSVGILNQMSFVDTLQDYLFLDVDGIRSWNAMLTGGNEGRESASLDKVDSLFEGIFQVTANCSAISFQSYVLFSVLTTEGAGILVYDITRDCWAGLDQLTGVGQVKQFAIAKQSTAPRLFAIDATKVYELYSSATYETAEVEFRGQKTDNSKTEISLANVSLVFSSVASQADVTVTEIVDDTDQETYTIPLKVAGPHNLTFPFDRVATQGFKVGVKVSWGNGAKLTHVQTELKDVTNSNSFAQRGSILARNDS